MFLSVYCLWNCLIKNTMRTHDETILCIHFLMLSSTLLLPCNLQFRQAKTEIISASKAAYSFISGIVSNTPATPENLSDEETEVSLCQGSCFKNLISISSKPSTSNSEQPEDSNNHIPQQQQQEHTEKNQPSS